MISPSRSNLLQRPRVVVQRDRAGVRDAERVERRSRARSARSSSSVVVPWMSRNGAVARALAGPVVEEAVVVGDQRVQPVDGDEVLGQRVGHAVVVRHGLRDADSSACVSSSQMPEPGQPVVGRRPVPVGLEADVDRLGRQDRRRPLDGVDLGDQRRHDQPGASGRCARRSSRGSAAAARRRAALCSRANSVCRRSGPATSSR